MAKAAKKQQQKVKIRPLGDRIVLEPLEEDEKTAGGIFLPDTAKEKPQRGRVVAAGPGNVLDYLKHPKVAACGGSWMVKSDLIAGGQFERITELTREAVAIAAQA